MDRVILFVYLISYVRNCAAGCLGVVYNNVCYWAQKDSTPCSDDGGDFAVVYDNITWQYLTTTLYSELSKYTSLQLGLYPEPSNISLSQIYSIDGGDIVTPTCIVEETEEFCFSWNIENSFIEGTDCKLGRHYLLCEIYEDCVVGDYFKINDRCYVFKLSQSSISSSLNECRKENGSLPVFTSCEELDGVRDVLSNLLQNQLEKSIWVGVTKYPNYWRTLDLTEIPFLYFNNFDDQIQGSNQTATQASYFKGCIVFQSLNVGFRLQDCLGNTAGIVCQTSNITDCSGVVVNSTCFWKHQETNENFHPASMICANYSSHLPVPQNFQELAALASLATSKNVWIGATITPWFNVLGEPMPWFNWNHGSTDDTDGNCVLIDKNAKWLTTKCDGNQGGGVCLEYDKGGPRCKLEWQTHCIWLIDPKAGYNAIQAQADCEQDGGFLAPITSEELTTQLQNTFDLTNGKYWIGVVKWRRRWFSSAGEQKWFNWGSDGNPAFSEESCVSFSPDEDYKWSVGCKTSRGHGYFCMKTMIFDDATTESSLTTEMTTTNLGTSPEIDLDSTTINDFSTVDVTDTTSGFYATTDEMTTKINIAKTTEMTTAFEMTDERTTELDTTTETYTTTVEVTTAQDATTEESTTSKINIETTAFDAMITTEEERSTTQWTSEGTATKATPVATERTTTTTSLASTTNLSIIQPPIIEPLKRCGIQITYPSTGRVWKLPCLCGCSNCLKPVLETNPQIVQELKEEIKKNLSVPLDQISTQIYKKISMPDKRPSAASMGIISTSIILTFLSIIIFFDIIKIALVVRNLWVSGGDESYLR